MLKRSFRYLTPVFLAFVLAAFGAAAASAQNSSDETWTGVYAGGYIGATHARSNVVTSTVFDEDGYFAPTSVPAINADGNRSLKSNGFTGGGTFGYNKQFGRIVVGAETDFGSQRISKSDSITGEYPCCGTDYTIDQQIKSDWLFTARPRIGVTAGNALIYATGGLAVSNFKYSAQFTDNDSDALESAAFKKTKAGYTAGGGVEYKVAKNWSVKGEYLFSDFGRISTTSDNLTTDGGEGGFVSWPENVFTHSAKVKTHNFRFGVNFHF